MGIGTTRISPFLNLPAESASSISEGQQDIADPEFFDIVVGNLDSLLVESRMPGSQVLDLDLELIFARRHAGLEHFRQECASDPMEVRPSFVVELAGIAVDCGMGRISQGHRALDEDLR